MNFKKIILPVLVTLLTAMTGIAQIANDPQGPSWTGTFDSMTHMPSIASYGGILPQPDNTPREAADKRSITPQVIIGKDPQNWDDQLAANPHPSAQSVRTAPPFLVYDAFTSFSSPSDPTMAVGPNHVFVTYNTAFIIYDKNGNVLSGPNSPSAIFGANGCCDLTVSYDVDADRWVLSFLGASGSQNIAVSDGPDPLTAGWNVYTQNFNDYQKLSIWSDGYYMTQNSNSSQKIFALERDEMLAGNPAAQIAAFDIPGIAGTFPFFSPQFLHVSDGNMPASGGATLVFLQDDAFGGIASDHIKYWTVDMDWATIGNSTVSAATEIPVTPFVSIFDGGSFANLTQPGGGTAIDAVQNTIYNQAQFKKFPTYNSAIFSFVVDTDGGAGELAGIRWVEFRQPGDNQPWSLFQEGTYTSPDGKHAWLGSLVMDDNGNIAMGYSAMAGPTTPNPTDFRVGSYYTGRFDGDAPGVMTVAEEVIGVSTSNVPNLRYCDYNKMIIDPATGDTFWFINEYMNGGQRRGIVGAFQLTPPQPNDVGVTSIDQPVNGNLTSAEDITITIRNFGSNDITNPEVQYTIDGGTPVVETFSGTINAGDTAPFTFVAQADLSAPGTYEIAARTNLPGDSNPNNDETTKTVNNTASNYCIPEALEGCNIDGIKRLVLNTLDVDDGGNGCNTEPAGSPQGYADRTNLSTVLSNQAGSNEYVLQAQMNWGPGVGVEALSVWIDFDDSDSFEASERLISGEFFTVANALDDFDLVIPVGAALGSHRMRVKAIDTSAGGDILDPCSNFDFGEVQDYTVEIQDILSVDNPAIAQANLVVVSLPNDQFKIILETPFDGIASIRVMNTLGQTLAFNNLEKEGNQYVYNLDMSYASSGVYFIQMGDQSSNTYQTAKIVVR